MSRAIVILAALACSVAMAVPASAAEYRVLHLSGAVEPGQVIGLGVEVETQAGDNLTGFGHYSFAIDLAFDGESGITATNVSNVVISTSFFDGITHPGGPVGADWIGTDGETTDVFAPNFGATVGDVLSLFDFSLSIPPGTTLGSTIIITPSEGFNENLTVNDDFDAVAPQNFAAATLSVVPEPATAMLLALGVCALRRWRRA